MLIRGRGGVFRLQTNHILLLARIALSVLVAAGAPAQAEGLPVKAKSRIQVVYFGAADCPYCQRWEAPKGARDAFLASPLAREVELHEARRASLKASPRIADVPQPARWVWDRAWIPRVTPAWLVAIDETVVLTVVGLEQWESNVRPLLERVAEERTRLRQQALKK